MVQKSRKLLRWGVMVALALSAAACGDGGSDSASARRPLLVVVIVDPTDSAKKGREQWAQGFRQLVNLYLPEESQVAFVRADHAPERGRTLKFDGSRASREEILKELEQMLKPRPCGVDAQGRETYCGSNVTGALDMAVRYAVRPENEGFERKMIIGWIDMHADSCQRDPKNPIRYPPPAEYEPPREAQAVELILHGVAEKHIDALRKRWQEKFKQLRLYDEGDLLLIKEHYQLKEQETVL